MKSILVSLVIVTMFAVVPAVTYAQGIPTNIPFGGTIAVYVPPTPLCLIPHTLIFDFISKQPMGIAAIPTSQVFSYFHLVKPLSFVLGTVFPTPIPCALPYKIFPISQVGTSL